MFKTAVYASSDESFLKTLAQLELIGLSKDSVFFADSRRFTRLDLINQNVGQWLLFIDHDCVLSGDVKEQIVQLLPRYRDAGGVVIAGLYENSVPATRLQRTHNWIANAWLEFSYPSRARSAARLTEIGEPAIQPVQPLILGGCFLVRTERVIEGVLPQDMWGAEDKLLAQILKQNRLNFYFHPEIKMKHNTTSRWSHFLRRAWLHGKNDIDYGITISGRRRYSEWLRKIASADFDLTALILLHFCIQKTARQVQQILRTNTR